MPSRPPKSTTGRLLAKHRLALQRQRATASSSTSAKGLGLAARLMRNQQMLQAAVTAIQQKKAQPGGNGGSTSGTPQAPTVTPKPVLTFTDVHAFNRAASQAKPNTVYKFGTYEWETDGQGRVSKVEGQINLKKHGRKTTDGVTTVSIGHSDDAVTGDVGFHLIGDQFDGPINNLNVVPGNGVSVGQLKSLNLSAYKRWENKIAKLSKTRKVTVRIDAVYSSTSKSTRPLVFTASYQDDNGKWVKSIFRNKAGG